MSVFPAQWWPFFSRTKIHQCTPETHQEHLTTVQKIVPECDYSNISVFSSKFMYVIQNGLTFGKKTLILRINIFRLISKTVENRLMLMKPNIQIKIDSLIERTLRSKLNSWKKTLNIETYWRLIDCSNLLFDY